MNEIKIFENEEFGNVRTVVIDGEPWFVGNDVARALGYKNPRKAMIDHVDDEDKGVTKCDTLGGSQHMTTINESGMYALILSSKLESAKRFKHWVTSEVLPSLRKNGFYGNAEDFVTRKEFEEFKYDVKSGLDMMKDSLKSLTQITITLNDTVTKLVQINTCNCIEAENDLTFGDFMDKLNKYAKLKYKGVNKDWAYAWADFKPIFAEAYSGDLYRMSKRCCQ